MMALANNEKRSILSLREEECAGYLLKGLSAKEIGKALGLSHRTVEGHLNNLKRKLGCNKTSSLIIKLLELGTRD